MSENKEYKPVLTKRDFVERYIAGEFGNRAPTWGTISEFLQSGYDSGLIHIRNRIAGGETYYNVEPRQVPGKWERIMRRGGRPEDFYLSAMCPTEKTILQGEVQQGINGLELYYTTIPKPMREALAERSRQVYGIIATSMLEPFVFLDANSREWLNVLLDRYPEHVIEFSTFHTKWGTLDNFNTVFWEVRNY